ncbi:phycobilisome rod-core linker polypeptide [Leptothoe spongobia]|uniref:Phycobilisome rod-core linker polypeptide n=1 Tax=Leptothoe spongobia TAU-MAC 1115 TaxID=1967444 RepID=A0A947GHH6_9CYAN|nr:phycobilisome rod-core linker polypeptide [Leptothoe spongobia]MBT9315610.1 phycobilisome rod-core linker polypeptide [Leptothoe spongobia TAU-MAC 1115]
MGNLTASASLGLDAFEGAPIELRPFASEDDLQEVIRAAYRQVLGNVHILANARLESAEALLRNGDITVRGFVRAIAQSELYSSLFFDGNSQYRFIELNFKHILGRAPHDQAEIRAHVSLYNDQGYAAEINSYLDGNEYIDNFGEATVPFPRSIRSQAGIKNEGFNRMFSLLRGPATSDLGKGAKLISSLAANTATPIKALAKGNSTYGNLGKSFKIAFASSQSAARLKRVSQQTVVVTFAQMSQAVQNIHKSGGKISSITELAS